MKTPLIALLALPLAGCISFGSKPPESLLTLTPSSTVAAGAMRTSGAGQAVTVVVPTAPAAIATNRVPVYNGATNLAYVKEALWVDSPARLFQRLVSETVAARTGRVVLDIRQYTADPGVRVSGTLINFGIDPAGPNAVVTYDAVLARADGGVQTQRFESRVPIAVVDANAAGAGLNQAANAVAADVADWVGR